MVLDAPVFPPNHKKLAEDVALLLILSVASDNLQRHFMTEFHLLIEPSEICKKIFSLHSFSLCYEKFMGKLTNFLSREKQRNIII